MSFDSAIKKPLTGERGSVDSAEGFTKQLKGLRYYQEDPEPWLISKALQTTKFELFKKGARVRVETRTEVVFGGTPPQVSSTPRDFICDQPFFTFIWKKRRLSPISLSE